jgi:choline dehydrogenase-like flavoprotein
LDASAATGIPRIDDYNGPEQDGVSMFQVFQKNGSRWSAADAFLRPVLDRPNLEVMAGATVLGLELDGARATGVRYRRGRGAPKTARAEGEVILCAGAIGSPQVLMLSGVGHPDELRAAEIEPRHELPGVGRNLQDHPYLTMLWEVSGAGPTLYGADKPKYLLEWLLRKSGPLTSSAAEVVAFVRTRPGLPAADIQFHMGALYFEKHGEEEFDGDAMTIAPVLVSPKARGQVWLRSADPLDKPRILTNSLSEPEDVASMVAGMQMAREIAAAPPLAEVVTRELKPGPSADSPERLDAALRERLELIYHPAGTCRMSDDGEDAVVDSQLRVHGIDGLRVADASIFPVIPGGNTNAPTIMVAERAADLIRGRVPAPA